MTTLFHILSSFVFTVLSPTLNVVRSGPWGASLIKLLTHMANIQCVGDNGTNYIFSRTLGA
jgi:hypothetical protein